MYCMIPVDDGLSAYLLLKESAACLCSLPVLGMASFETGVRVVLIGLKSRTDLNGLEAHVIQHYEGRIAVQVMGTSECLRVKPANVKLAEIEEQAAKGTTASSTAKRCAEPVSGCACEILDTPTSTAHTDAVSTSSAECKSTETKLTRTEAQPAESSKFEPLWASSIALATLVGAVVGFVEKKVAA